MIWRGILDRSSGYAEAGRAYLSALATVGYRNLCLDFAGAVQWERPASRPGAPLAPPQPLWEPHARLVHFYRGVDRSQVDQGVRLVHTDPTSASREAIRHLYNVLLTVWETERLPGDARYAIDVFYKEVWVPSEHNARVLRDSGVKRSKILVIPHAVETFELPKVEQPELEGRYVFYFIGSRNERKNPQAALRAYLREFRADDPVAFIYKSWAPWQLDAEGKHVVFDPGQVEVARLAREAGRTPETAAFVKAIDGDVPRRVIELIHAAGHCFVSSHRGEGFGLSLLEAKATGHPVIATRYGGPCDFLDYEDDPTSLTKTDTGIPFTLEPVQGMSTVRPGFDPGQRWAEPDEEALAAAMRRVFNERRGFAERLPIGRAAEFSYEKVGRRLSEMCEAAHAEAARTLKWKGGQVGATRPRVALVTSFNAPCGVSYYAEALAKGLIRADYKVEVYAPVAANGSLDRDPFYLLNIPYARVWQRGMGTDAGGDIPWLKPGPAGILHLQHEFSFWMEEHGLVEILRAAKARGWKTCVTLHTIMPAGLSHAAFFKAIVCEADAVTALGEAGAEALRGWCRLAGVSPTKVTVTPNVCVDISPLPVRAARQDLGLGGEEGFILLTPGFQSALKRVGDILCAIERLLADGRLDRHRFRYVVWGDAKHEANENHFEALAEGVKAYGLADVVVLRQAFLSNEDYAKLFSAADAVALFHSTATVSHSALQYDVLRFGKPSLSARSASLELLDEACSLKVESQEEIAEAIIRLHSDAELRRRLGTVALQKSYLFDPDVVRKGLIDLYRQLSEEVTVCETSTAAL